MTDTFKKLNSIVIPTSFGAVYTNPGSVQTLITEIRVSNASTSTPAAFTLWHGTQTNANLLTPIGGFVLQPGEMYVDDGRKTLASADVINGLQTVASILVITFYGDEFT